ncbi:hypothetical protein CAL65_19290 [Alkalilimnicola ehrlichii]|uniref:Uncharacterized protein n=1 Tax=Alkalilimnicola ehrlichii TaxID=351052 RepID=A0A3E0WIL0_9GAMM|nr:hypothetical protein CAL65_19290 [Alkalilimnicola ehrlichii]
MLLQLNVRGMLIGLFCAAVGGALIMAFTGLASNARLVTAQSYLLEDILPQQTAGRIMANVMGGMGCATLNSLPWIRRRRWRRLPELLLWSASSRRPGNS